MELGGSSMNIMPVTQNYTRQNTGSSRISSDPVITDQVELGTSTPPTLIDMLSKRHVIKPGDDLKPVNTEGPVNIYKTLTEPSDDVQRTRRRAPVILVHGTMADDLSLMNYRDAASKEGYPVGLSTYMTVKEGHRLQESGQVISREINSDRIQIAEKNLRKAAGMKNDPEALKQYFLLDESLHGNHPSTEKVAELLPGVVDKMRGILSLNREELLGTFSTRTKMLEEELTGQIMETGFGSWMNSKEEQKEVSKKAAIEIMDCLSPRAALVGHSMGGFVLYSIAMNPKKDLNDTSQFTYDAGNGVSTILTLSSPIGKGINKTLPIGLSTLGYEVYNKTVLKPLEGFPGMQFAMMNPFFNMSYQMGKGILKESMKTQAELSSLYTNPYTHLQKPGFAQITEGSSFIKKYVEGKKVPQGITAIAVTSDQDGISEPHRSKLDESQVNAHNLDVEVILTEEDHSKVFASPLTRAHQKLAQYPLEHRDEFRKEIFENPSYIPRILDRANSDGVRWNCLQAILENVSDNPGYLKSPEMRESLQAVREVARERIPFKESPSVVATQILDIIDGKQADSNHHRETIGPFMLTRHG